MCTLFAFRGGPGKRHRYRRALGHRIPPGGSTDDQRARRRKPFQFANFRIACAAMRGTDKRGNVIPGAAAMNAADAVPGTTRRAVHGRTVVAVLAATKAYFVDVPARAAYSDSASVNIRQALAPERPSLRLSHGRNSSRASIHETCMTGRVPRVRSPGSSGRRLQPPSVRQKSHSSNVTSNLPAAG